MYFRERTQSGTDYKRYWDHRCTQGQHALSPPFSTKSKMGSQPCVVIVERGGVQANARTLAIALVSVRRRQACVCGRPTCARSCDFPQENITQSLHWTESGTRKKAPASPRLAPFPGTPRPRIPSVLGCRHLFDSASHQNAGRQDSLRSLWRRKGSLGALGPAVKRSSQEHITSAYSSYPVLPQDDRK